jgi:hypothetical protein
MTITKIIVWINSSQKSIEFAYQHNNYKDQQNRRTKAEDNDSLQWVENNKRTPEQQRILIQL